MYILWCTCFSTRVFDPGGCKSSHIGLKHVRERIYASPASKLATDDLPPHPPRLATGSAHSSCQETARWPTTYRPNTRRRGRPADGACRVRRARSYPNKRPRPGAARVGEEANATPHPIDKTAVSHRAPESDRRPWGVTEGCTGPRKP